MRRIAVFVDAGYFWVQATTVVHGARQERGTVVLDYEKLREAFLNTVESQCPGADLLRVYWYDGPGMKGKTPHHISIDELDDFKLRLGTRNGEGSQKAVDGSIIADMISLAQAKAITHAILMSGDADLAPGVIAAQALGMRVHLLSLGPKASTSPFLAAEADRKSNWTDDEVKQFVSAVPAPKPKPASKMPAGQVALNLVHDVAPVQTKAATPATVGSTPKAAAATPAVVAGPIAHRVTRPAQPPAPTAGDNSTSSVPAEAPAASPDSAVPTLDYTALAQAVVERIDIEDVKRAGKGTSVPADIDRRLIAITSEAIGRPVEPEERKVLRSAFRVACRAATSAADPSAS